ncbi:MBL fold metallo-hydrolase [Peribacillus cavernae]|uniref:MBL fold metallo-hydrolase n=1 Tax=Peribacillus cavernae TaxID=1674310 RepID=UPI001FE3F1D4|nr:MBL fold metallo-hydrolase [Peribacillus cavernae]MDQ0220676.1 L-ascorbate metabolism protein UlaG (beta-lactamase superfamily) [Peribacillus cavernae]
MLKWNKERRAKTKDLSTQIPFVSATEVHSLRENKTRSSITWIGHSTFLIQMGGLNILTDPVWAARMGMQRRLTDPGIPLKELPEVDIVCISHGHYDHLDFPSIKQLKGNPVFYVPEGLDSLFKRKGYSHVIEACWWESFAHEELKLSFVPAQHWTRRGLFDTNSSHWGGWVLENNHGEESVYFVGDTGYFQGFQDISEKFKPKYILMPIGAYEPEWFMEVSHINPEDAIKAFLELNGVLFIPMHYGAYRLADDTGPEALERLMKEWKGLKLPDEQLKTLKIGETLWL